jgi:iron-sulfur cluster repair protein YtfE (RIC family)
MLVTFGARRGGTDGVDLLVECHRRIRRHLGMARALAGAHGHPAAEIRDTAAQVRRYFTEALPLHILDEEEAVLDLLVGRDETTDTALARMVAEHMDHEPALGRLIDLCAELQRDPSQIDRVAAELAPLIDELEPELLAHLEREERFLFSALRALPRADRDRLTAAIRERRAASFGRA